MKPRPSDQNSCPQSAQIDAFIDGALDADQKQRMTEHLRRCDSCRLERSDILALRKLLQHRPKVEVASAIVQRAKSTLATKSRGDQKRSLRDLLADFYADRPMALHGTAIALGIFVSVLTYGLGRLHQSQVQKSATESLIEVAESATEKDRLLAAELDRRFGAAGTMMSGGLRGRTGDLVIESLTVPAEDKAQAPDVHFVKDGHALDGIGSSMGGDLSAEALEKIRSMPFAGFDSDENFGDLEPLTSQGESSFRPEQAAAPEPAPAAEQGLARVREPVVFSAQAMEVLQDAGSLEDVSRSIGEAAPNWARLLTDALEQVGLVGVDEAEPGSRDARRKKELARDMIVILDNGKARLRMHITIAFGTDVEPRVEVKRAEAKSDEKRAKSRP